jgi:hypothetical protein
MDGKNSGYADFTKGSTAIHTKRAKRAYHVIVLKTNLAISDKGFQNIVITIFWRTLITDLYHKV